MASKQAIDSFLSCRRIAVVGVSRDPKDFSRAVFRAFVERGYDAVPGRTRAAARWRAAARRGRVGEVAAPARGGLPHDAARGDLARWSASAPTRA